MLNENNENADSQNSETDQDVENLENMSEGNNENIDEIDETEDIDALRDIAKKSQEKNRQLYARAKKAEGFKLINGEWVKPPQPKPKPEQKKESPSLSEEDIDKRIEEKFVKRELDSLNLGDELKKEVQGYAKLHNVSIQEAINSHYIKFRQDEIDTKRRNEEAAAGGGNATFSIQDYDKIDPTKFDLQTKEGREQFKEWEKETKKRLG